MKKVVSLVLALLLLTGSIAMAEPFTGTVTNPYYYQDYTQWPVVGEGEQLKISVLCPRHETEGIEAKDMWFWNFFPKVTGIEMEVEQVPDSGKKDAIQLRLGSAALPDLMWLMEISPEQLVMYGQEEGLLLDLKPYMNEDVMPNLMKLNNEFYPDLISTACLSDGSCYSLPCLMNNNPGNGRFIMVNNQWMAEADITEIPHTLDEFVDMLYKFKALHPDEVILGGSWATNNPIMYVMNAFGYLADNNGTEVAIRDGKAVIPAADPTFKEVLALMKKFYDDGIISKDFFTLEASKIQADAAEGKMGVLPRAINGIAVSSTGVDTDMYTRWDTMEPLTSEYNSVKQWPLTSLVKLGNCVLSANCPNPEKVLRALDAFYAHEMYVYLHWGPWFGSEDGMGIIGGYAIDEEWNVLYLDVDGNNLGSTKYRGTVSNSEFALGNGAYSTSFPKASPKQYKFYVWGKDITHPQYNDGDSNGYCRNRYEITFTPYETAGFPFIVFMSGDQTYELQDLSSVLLPYMEGEIAKFITGRRSLDEYDQYLNELNDLGMDEYAGFYADYYAAYKGE